MEKRTLVQKINRVIEKGGNSHSSVVIFPITVADLVESGGLGTSKAYPRATFRWNECGLVLGVVVGRNPQSDKVIGLWNKHEIDYIIHSNDPYNLGSFSEAYGDMDAVMEAMQEDVAVAVEGMKSPPSESNTEKENPIIERLHKKIRRAIRKANGDWKGVVKIPLKLDELVHTGAVLPSYQDAIVLNTVVEFGNSYSMVVPKDPGEAVADDKELDAIVSLIAKDRKVRKQSPPDHTIMWWLFPEGYECVGDSEVVVKSFEYDLIRYARHGGLEFRVKRNAEGERYLSFA